MKIFSGNIVDVIRKRIFKGYMKVDNGIIISVHEDDTVAETQYIMPGLIDAHIHIESSMLIPSEFARIASIHGTVAVVADPHEIANVMGMEGIQFMINNGKKVPFKFYYAAPSCVPATYFETSGAALDLCEIDSLLQIDDVKCLGEMMNFPAVLRKEDNVMQKISTAQKYGKPIDGHFPSQNRADIEAYHNAGISTDHECTSIEEARLKASLGMYVQIREGSAAKDFENLINLLSEYPDIVMFCSDDKHPDELIKGHMNTLVVRALEKGYSLVDILRAMTYNPVKHYNLNVGLLQQGDPADFIIVNDIANFIIKATYVNGMLIAENGVSLVDQVDEMPVNQFEVDFISEDSLQILNKDDDSQIRVIGVQQGQLYTSNMVVKPLVSEKGFILTDLKNDILKIVVVNRYRKSPPVVGYIHGFGLKGGAMASTIAHDSHNIIAVGTSDKLISKAVNALIACKGGISFFDDEHEAVLPLPYGGLMANDKVDVVAVNYQKLDELCKFSGSKLLSPYMTLSFMALLVIPSLKICDKGLFDGIRFDFVDLFCN